MLKVSVLITHFKSEHVKKILFLDPQMLIKVNIQACVKSLSIAVMSDVSSRESDCIRLY